MEIQSRNEAIVILESGLMLFINFAALFGNVTICWVMYKTPRLHTVTNLYIFSLAFSDLLMAFFVMPFSSGVLILGHWPFGPVICNIQGFLTLVLAWVSLQTIALTAVNRYFCVTRPSIYRAVFTVNKSLLYILAVWFLVILIVSLPLFVGGAGFKFRPERCGCFIFFEEEYQNSNKFFTALHLALFIALPMVTIIGCYSKVFKAVKQHLVTVHSFPLEPADRQRLSGEEIKITRVLLVMVMDGFLVCWIPIIITELVNTNVEPRRLPRAVFMMYSYLWYISSAINPVIYGFMSRPFRREALQALFTRVRRRSVDEHEL